MNKKKINVLQAPKASSQHVLASMKGNRGINTKSELLLRKNIFKSGLRYRIHYKIPGKPDIVFPHQKIAIFVSCFL